MSGERAWGQKIDLSILHDLVIVDFHTFPWRLKIHKIFVNIKLVKERAVKINPKTVKKGRENVRLSLFNKLNIYGLIGLGGTCRIGKRRLIVWGGAAAGVWRLARVGEAAEPDRERSGMDSTYQSVLINPFSQVKLLAKNLQSYEGRLKNAKYQNNHWAGLVLCIQCLLFIRAKERTVIYIYAVLSNIY